MSPMRSDFPLPDTTWDRTAGYWEGAAAGELRIPRCDTCGRWCWYPRERCRTCDGESFTWTATSGRGTLFSWVVVTHAFLPQFADLVPFAPALVALDDDPAVRIATRVVDADPATLDFEMPLEAVYRPISFAGVEGEVVAPLFRPTSLSGGSSA